MIRLGIPAPSSFASYLYGHAASPAVHASGQTPAEPAAPTAEQAAATEEQRIITQNMWLRRAVLTLTFFGVGLTAGQVLGLVLPSRRDRESERDA